jgi:prevent-host-death family protein
LFLAKGENMKTMTVTEFKAKALKAIAEVSDSRETLLVTKRGAPIVQVIPYSDNVAEAVPGRLKHMFDFEEDIVAPLGSDMWSSAT